MTLCHHLQAARVGVPKQNANANGACHHLKLVTSERPVTQETIATQGKSSLSPVSPVKSIPLYIRAIGVWSCHLSPVTPVTCDGCEARRVAGLSPCRASTQHRIHSAVCNDLKKVKGGFDVPDFVEEAVPSDARWAWGFVPLSRQARRNPRSWHPDNFSRWGNFGGHLNGNQRGENRSVIGHSQGFFTNIKSNGKEL
jgi:hypothetical protein